jgi:hypothetical protein
VQPLALLAALVLASPAPPPRAPRASPAESGLRTFEAGQVWSYRTRPGEARSRAVVCRVDAATSAGPIVHVQVAGVAIRNPAADGGVTTIAGHLPLTADALRGSVVALEAGGARCAGFEDAHGAWREALAAGHAGVLHVGLAEALDVLQRAVDRSAARTVERPAEEPAAHEPLAMTR